LPPLSLALLALLHDKSRVLACLVAIALGVALGYAVALINRAALGELDQALRMLAGEADFTLRGPREGFDESLYPNVAALPAVAVASPAVEVQARVAGREEPLRIVGLDVFRAAQIQPALLAQADDFLDTLRADTVFLSPAARVDLALERGDTLRLQSGMSEVRLRVAGWLRPDGVRVSLAVMDIAAAQRQFGREGRIDRIDLKLRPGASPQATEDALRALTPPGVTLERPDRAIDAARRLTRAYRVNLNVLALVALFTGGLLVFATQALSVVRRRSQLALLRVLGVTRDGLMHLMMVEAALVGAAGAALGVGLGYGAAFAVLRWVGPDLGAGYFQGLRAAPAVEPAALGLFFALGVAAALAGSLVPAREAARAAPAPALKAGDDVRAFERLQRAWPGLALLALGMLCLPLPPVAGLPVFGYLAIALLLIGTLALLPRAMAWLLRRLPALRSTTADLARAQLGSAPGPASLSLAPVVAAVGLTVSMAIMVASFRHSLDDWLDQVLPADLYLRAGGPSETAYLAPQSQERIVRLPGVRRAEFLRATQLRLHAAQAPVTLLARDIERETASARLPLVSAPFAVPASQAPLWVSELVRDVYGFDVGELVELPIAQRKVPFTVAGVWRDYARQNGALVVERARYARLTGDDKVTDAALWLELGADAAQVEQRLRAALPGGDWLEVARPGEIRSRSLDLFDRSFAATYALEAAAVLIGLFGLSTSLTAQVLARRREFAMLRHIGMTRVEIRDLLTLEGLFTSAAGMSTGAVLGGLIGLVLIHVVIRQSFHWSMALHVPWLALAGFGATLLALALIAARAAARRATSGEVVRAVREDW
jgi:putative ABC transport system permease protein